MAADKIQVEIHLVETNCALRQPGNVTKYVLSSVALTCKKTLVVSDFQALLYDL